MQIKERSAWTAAIAFDSLEFLDEKGELKQKADIFTKRTIRRAEPVTSVDTASEALAVSSGKRRKWIFLI